MKIIRVLLIIGIMILIIMNSCSLLIDGYERNVGYNSICWEDNDHILVYAKIGAYDYKFTGTSNQKENVWVGGEIWRIDVYTGEKELLMRKKESEYALGDIEIVNIRKSINSYYINNWFTTYKIHEDFNGWDSIGDYIFTNYSNDGNTTIALFSSNEYEDQIRRYNLTNNTYENIYTPNDLVKNLDYDYSRNLLLINNIKLVDLNTDAETILVEWGDIINGRMIYSDGGIHGDIFRDTITIDVRTQNDIWNKVYIDPNNYEQKTMKDGFMGILSPNGLKGAHGHNSDGGATGTIDIYSVSGVVIKEIIFDKDKI